MVHMDLRSRSLLRKHTCKRPGRIDYGFNAIRMFGLLPYKNTSLHPSILEFNTELFSATTEEFLCWFKYILKLNFGSVNDF